MYDIAVCDDDALDRSLLISRIKDNKLCEIGVRIHEYSSGTELLSAMDNISFALIFLDIQMDGMDGDETAIQIRKRDFNVVLVFNTGFIEPTPKRIEVQPYRYIMKNMALIIKDEYIDAALRKMVRNASRPTLYANVGKERYMIKAEDVIYIERYRKGLQIHITEAAYDFYQIPSNKDGSRPVIRVADKMENIYDRLRSYGFGCPHDSYIINFNYLISHTGKTLTLAETKDIFPVSRSKAETFNKMKDVYIRAKYVEGN